MAVVTNYRPIINPYLRPPQHSAPLRQNAGVALPAVVGTQVVTQQQRNMGVQSQVRQGAIHNCRQRASRKHTYRRETARFIQQGVDGGVAFDPVKHCLVCKARHNGSRIPKRAHHKCCKKTQQQRECQQ